MSCEDCARLARFPLTVVAPHEHGGQWYGRAPCGCRRLLACADPSVFGEPLHVQDVDLCRAHAAPVWEYLNEFPEAFAHPDDLDTPWLAAEAVEGLVRA